MTRLWAGLASAALLVAGAVIGLAASAVPAVKQLIEPKPVVPTPAPTVPAASAVPAYWFLGGSTGDLPSCANCAISLPATGSGNFGSVNNTANAQLSPGVDIIASRLNVSVDVAPGPGTSRIFILGTQGVTGGLRCDIVGTAKTCSSSAATSAIPAASILEFQVASDGNVRATRVKYSWGATPK